MNTNGVNAILVQSSDNLITGNKIHGGNFFDPGSNGNGYPVYIDVGPNIFDGNELYDFPRYGVHVNRSQGGALAGVVVRNNNIHDGTTNVDSDAAIVCSTFCTEGNLFYNNIVHNQVRGHGIIVSGSGTLVANNTIIGSPQKGIYVYPINSSGVIVKNNISYQNGTGDMLDEGSGTTWAKNLCGSTSTECEFGGDPLFNDVANHDYSLQSGSPALGAGEDLSSIFTKDFVGRTRTVPWSIGAYAATPSQPSCPSAPALVAQYSFDNIATDSSGNGNDATLGTGVTYSTGKYNQGVTFSGAGGITVPHSESLYLCSGFTIEIWANIPAVTNFKALVTSNYDGQEGWFLYAGTSGYAQDGAPVGGYCTLTDCAIAIWGTNLPVSTWTHIAVTYDATLQSGNVKLWINGSDVATADGTVVLSDWSGNMRIGGSPFPGEFLPTGSIVDEVRIYNYARNSSQITSDMDKPINPPGLVASYGFDEGTGTTVADSSGHSNNGSFGTGVSWTVGGQGNALAFDGSGAVNIPDSDSLDLTTGMTLEAWVYPMVNSSNFIAVMAKNYTYFIYASSTGYCGSGSPLGGLETTTADYLACYPTILPLNTWTHMAVTYDGSTVKLYLNAIFVASGSAAESIPTSSGTLQIGGSQYGEYFIGAIDEVRVFDHARSQAEIEEDMNTPI